MSSKLWRGVVKVMRVGFTGFTSKPKRGLGVDYVCAMPLYWPTLNESCIVVTLCNVYT